VPPGAVDVSVLIPVRDEAAVIRDVARDMLAQRFEGTIEFLFVDGRSQDSTLAILRELEAADPRVRVLDNPAKRTPQALNLALRHARGGVIARMDAHTHYPPDYIARGVARLRAGGVESVSGPQIARGDGLWSRPVALALSSRLGTGGADFRHSGGDEFEVDSGFTGLWRRETLERLGGWDEEWLNDQDFELAARIRKTGGRIVCVPAMAADYLPRDSLSMLARQYHRYGFYRVKTSLRHPESLRRSHVLAPGLVLTAAAAVAAPRSVRRFARAGLASYGAAVAVTTAQTARSPADAAALPAVFATMHFAWGIGFLRACAVLGVPWRALSALVSR
jgi:cellulose synthase/poly-beta-1,6-N-acetylglucosamine synthase-like glycosyltransferase